jgi:transposase
MKLRKRKVYQIDTLFAAHDRTVILLPQYMCDSNPIELAWREIKENVESYNTTADVNNKSVRTCSRRDKVVTD